MNKLEIFERVAGHLRSQGRRSRKGISCQYRGPEGTSCAAGCLISDELYDPKIEGFLIRMGGNHTSDEDHGAALIDKILNQIGIHADTEERSLLMSLQHLHDYMDDETWTTELLDEKLALVAKNHQVYDQN